MAVAVTVCVWQLDSFLRANTNDGTVLQSFESIQPSSAGSLNGFVCVWERYKGACTVSANKVVEHSR